MLLRLLVELTVAIRHPWGSVPFTFRGAAHCPSSSSNPTVHWETGVPASDGRPLWKVLGVNSVASRRAQSTWVSKVCFMLSRGTITEHAGKCSRVLSLPLPLSFSRSFFPQPSPSLSSTSPPVSSSFHQDEDCWVRKILSGLTKHDFKLRSRPRIFSVSLLS